MVVFGVLFFFLLVGWHGFPPLATPNATNGSDAPPLDPPTSEADHLGNIAIHILTALFTYISFFTLPWRVANAVHLLGCRRSCEAGRDFYGRATKGIWCAQRQPFVAPLTRRPFDPSPL